MTGTPPPGWSHIPGADRAHLINPAAEPSSPKKRYRIKKIFTKPLVWLLGLLVAAIGGFTVNYLTKALEAEAIKATDAMFVYDVHPVDPPARDLAGYLVPSDQYFPEENTKYPDPNWIYEHNGTAAGWGGWEIILESKRNTMITIVDIRAENITCRDPVGGTYLIFATQGEGEPTNLGITIDAPAPDFKVIPPEWYILSDLDPDASLASFPSYAQNTVVTLNPGEQHSVRFYAHAAQRTCTWQVVLEYAADGVYQTVQLDPQGENIFSLAAVLALEEYETVVVPYPYCQDYRDHAVSGKEAARILAERDTTGSSVDCLRPLSCCESSSYLFPLRHGRFRSREKLWS